MKKGFSFVERKRRPLTAIFVLVSIFAAILTRHSWEPGGSLDVFFDLSGILLVLVGVSGRVWSTMYIGGKKNQALVTEGPYSMCRNPLYLFSFIAGMGVCLELENLFLIPLYFTVFLVFYSLVIKSEERRLAGLFGAEFDAFRRSTPAFFPKLWRLRLGRLPDFSSRLVLKTVGNASVFMLLIPLSMLIEDLQESGVIPTIWNIP